MSQSIIDAFNNWNEEIKPMVIEQYGEDDDPALSESWNNYTDSLCKDGELSNLQYHHCPAFDDVMPGDDIEYLLESMGVGFDATQMDSRDNAGDWSEDATHWNVEIYRGNYSFTIQYSMGSAHTGEPELKDIMYGLLMDIQGTGEDFEDWCANYGYDEDSRKALRIYEACKETSGFMSSMFAPDELEGLHALFQDY